MIINTTKNSIDATVIGYRLNEGDFNGKHYCNYILTLSQTIPENNGKGYQCIEMTMADTLNPEDYYSKHVHIEFRYYRDSKRQKIDTIAVV